MTRRAARLSAAALGTALALGSMPAAADDLQVCLGAHEQAQRLRREGKLSETRPRLEACTKEACPEPVRQDCAGWLDELLAAQPTIIVIARERGSSAAITDARVLVDGRRIADKLTGSAFEVDPGQRRIRVETADGRSVEASVFLAEGEKGRRVEVTLAPKPARPPPPPEPGTPAIVFVLGGIGVAGLAGFGVLAGLGLAKENEVADECEPRCSVDRIDDVKRLYIAADISGAIGVLAGAAAVTIALVQPGRRSPPVAVRAAPTSAWIEGRW